MTHFRTFGLLCGLTGAFLFLLPTVADAASGAVIGSVTVEQNSPSGTLGTWTLLTPDQSSMKFSTATYTADITLEGNYTLFAEPPEGMSAKVYLYKGDELIRMLDRPQISLVIAAGDNFRISITYILTRVGEVSIMSDPNGIPFRLEGPNKITVNDVTPYSLTSTPEGQYTVQYMPPGCIHPRPQSLLLRKDGRLQFAMTVDCDTLLVKPTEENPDPEDDSIGVSIGGETVFFTDVPQSAWYATYIFDAAKTGIISGYNDESGQPLGRFGPENPVTIAEIAKIAHKLAGINERGAGRPENAAAENQWYASYIASAERLDWLLFQDTALELNRPATRGEVIVTLLQALDLPLEWPKGDLFSDVHRRTTYAAAIETAARAEIVAGSLPEGSAGLPQFRPTAPINRAEIAKIVTILMEVREK
ncbi:MAG: S-layer homology domain-containing protein [Patescibacteria group bacterium]